MNELFLKIVDMSITSSWLVLAVLVVRLLLRRSPKWIACLLWGLVAIRLICPVSIESSLSLIPTLSRDAVYSAETEHTARGDILNAAGSVILEKDPSSSKGEIQDSSGSVIQEKDLNAASAPIGASVFAGIWLTGMGTMLVYTMASYCLLGRKVATAFPVGEGIRQSEFVDAPFVLGMIRPVIYLPHSMDAQNMFHVIAHEQAHIRRKDHWWKPLGFLLLTIHWFNPLMWVAYILLCRDIELACDEKVIKELDSEQRADYSQALVACSVNRRIIAACPLAFGEVGVKERVKSIMNYRKPAFRIILAAMVVCLIVAVCFMTNPKEIRTPEPVLDSLSSGDVEWAQITIWGNEREHISLDEVQIRELIGILNDLEAQDFVHSKVPEHDLSLMIYCGGKEILLHWDGEYTEFNFDSETVSGIDEDYRYLNDQALNRFLSRFYPLGYGDTKADALTETARIYLKSQLETEDSACSLGNQLAVYTLEEDQLAVIDYEMYPVFLDDKVVAFATCALNDDGGYNTGCSVDFAESFWRHYSNDPEQAVAIVYAKDGVYLVRDNEPAILLSGMPLADYASITELEYYRDSMVYAPIENDLLDEKPGADVWIVDIADRTVTEGLPTDEAIEPFFEDEECIYSFPSIRSHLVMVTYNNGNSEDIKTALENGRATIGDLDTFGIHYYVEPKTISMEPTKTNLRGFAADYLFVPINGSTYRYALTDASPDHVTADKLLDTFTEETRIEGIVWEVYSLKEYPDMTKLLLISGVGSAWLCEYAPARQAEEEALQAVREAGFVVEEDGKLTDGKEAWEEFYEKTQRGEHASIYVAHYYSLEPAGTAPGTYEAYRQDYPALYIDELEYDGEQFVLRTESEVRVYEYLMKYTGTNPAVSWSEIDEYTHYILTHDNTVTWDQLWNGLLSSASGAYIDHYTICTELS